jgi:Zn-finger domain-containing protein
MENDEIITYKIDSFDTQKFQDTFVEWFSQFKENVIDKEFENGSKGEGVVVKTKDGLSFEFSTKWKVSIEKVDDEDQDNKGNK